MPRSNHLALICELAKAKTKQKGKTLNSVPVVEDGAKQEGLVL